MTRPAVRRVRWTAKARFELILFSTIDPADAAGLWPLPTSHEHSPAHLLLNTRCLAHLAARRAHLTARLAVVPFVSLLALHCAAADDPADARQHPFTFTHQERASAPGSLFAANFVEGVARLRAWDFCTGLR